MGRHQVEIENEEIERGFHGEEVKRWRGPSGALGHENQQLGRYDAALKYQTQAVEMLGQNIETITL